MERLNIKLSIKTKTMLVFLTIALIAAGFGLYFENEVNKINTISAEIAQYHLPMLSKVEEIRFLTISKVAALREYIISQKDESLLNYQEISKKNKNELNYAIEMYNDAGLQKILMKIKELNNSFDDAAQNTIIPKSQSEGIIAASKAELDLNMSQTVNQIISNLKQYQEKVKAEINLSQQGAINRGNNTQSNLIIEMVIITLLGGTFSILLGRMLSKPLGKLNAISKSISEGDYTKEISHASNDEVGVLADNFKCMQDNSKYMIKKVGELIGASEGLTINLSTTAKEIHESSIEAAGATEEISRGSVDQAREAERVTIMMDALSKQITKAVEHIELMNKASDKAQKVSVNGIDAVKDLSTKSEANSIITDQVKKVIVELYEKSQSISTIIDAIQRISSQTNLLALNAAIEAARAGEAGRGFAVVSEEIRKLAEQTNNSSKEISNIITDISGSTNEIVELITTLRNTVTEESESVTNTKQTLDQIIGIIRDNSEEMKIIIKVIEEIAIQRNTVMDAVTNISAISEESVANIEEVSARIEDQSDNISRLNHSFGELEGVTGELKSVIQKFKV